MEAVTLRMAGDANAADEGKIWLIKLKLPDVFIILSMLVPQSKLWSNFPLAVDLMEEVIEDEAPPPSQQNGTKRKKTKP